MAASQRSSDQLSPINLYKNAEKSARIAGLRYVSDQQPGIRRQRWGRGFSYIDIDGTRIQEPKQKTYFKQLAIPPSWENVWICCDQNGHLLVTGRDLKGRKQYRYHPEWISLREQLKFDRLIPFTEALPVLRKTVQSEIEQAVSTIQNAKQKDRTKSMLDKSTVIAATVQLLDSTFIRIGNTQYAQANKSYGLTTLKNKHVDISSADIDLHYIGKSGVSREIHLQDATLAKLVKRCAEIPGQTLFQYFDEESHKQSVDSGDINEYLQIVMNGPFSAKDFRTWGGTVAATTALLEKERARNKETDKQTSVKSKKNRIASDIVEAVKVAAKQLGNRPATCRKYYIHPAIFKTYEAKGLAQAIDRYPIEEDSLASFLDIEERNTLSVLRANQL
ncbi:DNA topoisomerase IB [cf. Phormidesmis sp. LEGE 11477]|uniref:DNA topoisomerase IB n=1 Tax=cf. Phormidesmis sp. LEGE 11477 TaxID=1828680 RepID=UPI00187E4C60|nr:DNA topoisomerase IB [cf. Phormidesmis sp. LEGE 11477]MBE9062578.1 DNA topoisomerase IB [cf. Phormidesmis sp. LEGE 11477]